MARPPCCRAHGIFCNIDTVDSGETPKKLVLEDGKIHIWSVSLSLPPQAEAHLEGLLNSEERHRAEQFRFIRDRRRYTISRGALRSIIGMFVHRPPEGLVFGYGKNGKPYLGPLLLGEPLQFSLSHCLDMTLIAVCSTHQLGIDVERSDRRIAELELIVSSYLRAQEQSLFESTDKNARTALFLNLWTRREAVAKALGLNLSAALSFVDIPVYEPGAAARFYLREAYEGHPGSCKTMCFLQDLSLNSGHVGAVCVAGNPCTIVFHDFEPLFGNDVPTTGP